LVEHGGQGSNRLLELPQFEFYAVFFALTEYDSGMRRVSVGKPLGLDVPASLLARADAMIE